MQLVFSFVSRTAPFYYCVGIKIPLEDMDNLEGDHLWMRPEYILKIWQNVMREIHQYPTRA